MVAVSNGLIRKLGFILKDYKTTVGQCAPPRGQSGEWCYYAVIYIPTGLKFFDGKFKGTEKEARDRAEWTLGKRKGNSSVVQPDKVKVPGRMGIKLDEKQIK